jgi:hypothetical protein
LSEFAPNLFETILPALELGSHFGSNGFASLGVQAVDEMDAIHLLLQSCNLYPCCNVGFHSRQLNCVATPANVNFVAHPTPDPAVLVHKLFFHRRYMFIYHSKRPIDREIKACI